MPRANCSLLRCANRPLRILHVGRPFLIHLLVLLVTLLGLLTAFLVLLLAPLLVLNAIGLHCNTK